MERFNNLPLDAKEERNQVLKDLLGSIGAGSVVTKDIPPYSVAVGNPCKVIRKSIEEE